MKSIMADNKRIIEVCERLVSEKRARSLAAIAMQCGKTSQYFTDLKKGKQRYSREFLEVLCEEYPVNKGYVLEGTGSLLREQKSGEQRGVPFYDMDVTASIAESFSDFPPLASYHIDFPPLSDCTAAFPVYGESMEPDFLSGEIVLVKEIRNVNSMLWGEPHLIITNANCDNLRTIKNVYISPDRKNFILRATNPRFAGDTIVRLEDVIKIFLIKGKISRKQL